MSDAERYLEELRRALPAWCRRRLVAEVREHFESALAAESHRGVDAAPAEQLTIERLGSAQALAEQFLADLRSGALGPVARIAAGVSPRRLAVPLAGLALTALVAIALVAARSAAAPPAQDRSAVSRALAQIGASYAWGGASPARGFDASGLVVWAYAHSGRRALPHDAADLWRLGRHVARGSLRPGDLVFFDGRQLVGIYVGRGRFVAAEHTGTSVGIRSLTGRLASRYDGAVRIPL